MYGRGTHVRSGGHIYTEGQGKAHPTHIFFLMNRNVFIFMQEASPPQTSRRTHMYSRGTRIYSRGTHIYGRGTYIQSQHVMVILHTSMRIYNTHIYMYAGNLLYRIQFRRVLGGEDIYIAGGHIYMTRGHIYRVST